MQLLTALIGLGLVCLYVRLIHGEIRAENFYGECESGSICYFLDPSRNSYDPTVLELPENSSICEMDKSAFCMRVDMRPVLGNPCTHEFELAAVNVKSDQEYIAIAFSRDNQMAHDYAFYCINGTAFFGLIEKRTGRKGVLIASQRWKPNPTIKKDFNQFLGMPNGNHFMRCGFVTKKLHHAKKEYFNLRIGAGANASRDSDDDWWFFMAHGTKTSTENDDLSYEDKHIHTGYTSNALRRLEAPESEKHKCSGHMLLGSLHWMHFVIFVIIANCVVS